MVVIVFILIVKFFKKITLTPTITIYIYNYIHYKYFSISLNEIEYIPTHILPKTS